MWGALAAAAGNALGGFFGAREQRKAAEAAAQRQMAATNRGIDFQGNQFNQAMGQQQGLFNQALGQQQGQFDQGLGLQMDFLNRANGLGDQQLGALSGLFSPYTQAGADALGGMNQYAQGGLNAFNQQQALAGGLGSAAQQQAIGGLESSPLFQSLARQQEDAILQNASATGGLRGGNVQRALADSRSNMLNQFTQQQFGNLGSLSALGASNFSGLAGLGQNSAASQAQGNLGVLSNQSSLLGQIAGNVGSASNQFAGNAANLANQYGLNALGLSNAYGNNVNDLLSQQGGIGATEAVNKGRANASMWNTLGNAPGYYNAMQAMQNRPLGSGAYGDQLQTLLAQLQGRGGLLGGAGGGQ